MNLATIADRHAADRRALVSRGETISYGELRDRAAQGRRVLTGLGLEPGDRVAIVGENDADFVASYLAVLGAGLVAAPLNPQSPDRELARELERLDCRAAITDRDAGGWADPVQRVLTPDELAGSGGDADSTPVVERAGDDLAVLLFTTGTAGPPQPAMLTHGNLRSNIDQLLAHPAQLQTADDVVLGVLPMFHIFGLNVMLGGTLATGSTLVLVQRFEPEAAIEAMIEHGITLISGPPTLFAAFTALPESEAATEAFRSMRLAASGAAPLPGEVAEAFEARYGLRLHQGYGLTEASPAVTTNVGLDAPVESIGVPLPGVDVRLVDDDGEDVLEGDSGEIWVRGPNVFAGYWRDDEATAATLHPDGWLRTGDLAVTDDAGRLYITERAKDLIIVSGFNVHPFEVEQAVMEHPSVQDAAAVGMPHAATGEAVKVFVVLRPDAEPVDGPALQRFCADHLARYKVPREVEIVNEIPHGFAGKLLRRALR